jgi:hypothetical protein
MLQGVPPHSLIAPERRREHRKPAIANLKTDGIHSPSSVGCGCLTLAHHATSSSATFSSHHAHHCMWIGSGTS